MLVMAKTDPLPDLATLSHAEKDLLIVSQRARIEELESGKTIRKDSHNSSVPPSADGLTKKTRSLRKRSKNKAGGQPGHTGTTLTQAEQPSRTVVHPLPTQCERCQRLLPEDGARMTTRRQVIDIPTMPCVVVEH